LQDNLHWKNFHSIIVLSLKNVLIKHGIKKKEAEAENVAALVRRFNSMSKWVSSIILGQQNLAIRTAILNQFILIAKHFKDHHNFNGMTEIVAGLSNSAITRLQKTWNAIPPNLKQTYDSLVELISPQSSYKIMRATLKESSPPTLPYIGIYLSDLTFIEEGNPNVVQDKTTGIMLINFEKRNQVANVILEIQSYQQQCYYFQEEKKNSIFFHQIHSGKSNSF